MISTWVEDKHCQQSFTSKLLSHRKKHQLLKRMDGNSWCLISHINSEGRYENAKSLPRGASRLPCLDLIQCHVTSTSSSQSLSASALHCCNPGAGSFQPPRNIPIQRSRRRLSSRLTRDVLQMCSAYRERLDGPGSTCHMIFRLLPDSKILT